LTPDDLATQLQGFRIKGLSARKDEIGSLYQSLNTLTQQVSELFGEKERFASDVAHELKNPIASIIAHTENYDATQSESANTVIGKVRQQAQRMNKLVTEISEAAIVDNDLVTKKRERVNVSGIISEIVNHYAEVNEYPSVKISADLQQNIQMEVLPERIGQITVNLIENALSFAQPKGEIRVTLKKQIFSRAILTIEDSGPGVREELRELIFERFFSKRTGASHSENSSGLGLYISKQIVEAHGGEIKVEESENLQGAKFVVSL
jgi:two-component system sensor histidine kinase ChvG